MHRNKVMHTQLCTNVTMNSTLKNGNEKNNTTGSSIVVFSSMMTRDPQTDHNSDKPLPKYCS